MQVTLNIFISFAIYLLIALSFNLIYYPTKFFHLAHAVIITLGAYFTFFFSQQLGFPLWLSIPFAITLATAVALLFENHIYKPLRNKNVSSWALLIASLGIYVVLQNLVSMLWGDYTKSIRTWPVKAGHEVFGGYITNVQIITIVMSIVLFTVIVLFLKYNLLGKQIRAVSSNKELSNIFGISSEWVIFWSFAIGSALAAIAGILIALDTDMTPTMGFHVFLYAVVAMIIGGVGSYKGLVSGALLLATAQHLSAYFIASKWMDATAYIILILFLIYKPLGFSGKRLRKVEI